MTARNLLVLLAALLTPAAAATGAEELRGSAQVVSGNEVIIGKRIVKLFGMVAPGLEDICEVNGVKIKCGIVAWAELVKLADGQYVSCDIETAMGEKTEEAEADDKKGAAVPGGKRQPDTKPGQSIIPWTTKSSPKSEPSKPATLATCYLGETDLNEALVRSGWALAVPAQTDRYIVDEVDAKESLRGLWSSTKKPRRRAKPRSKKKKK